MSQIVFIAKYPTGWLKQDGASIRFLAIDNLYQDFNRIYIESFNFPIFTFLYYLCRNFKRKYYKLPVINNKKICSYRFLSKSKTKKIFDDAQVIYIENFTNLVKLDLGIIKKYGHKMILDFHGCVIEEMEAMNKPLFLLNNMKLYEKVALENIKTFVSVTNNMSIYFKNKYPLSKEAKYIELPIYKDCKVNTNLIEKNSDIFTVIYSGKNQVWQNCEMMIKTIKEVLNLGSCKHIKFKIFSPDIDELSNLLQKHDILNIVSIESLSADELENEYTKAHFGFVLRDDNTINRVACPTKLIEYMQYGIIPIVLQPEIGDFNKLGYKYILNEDLINGNIPTLEEQEVMRKINYNIIEKLNEQVKTSKQDLLDMVSI